MNEITMNNNQYQDYSKEVLEQFKKALVSDENNSDFFFVGK